VTLAAVVNVQAVATASEAVAAGRPTMKQYNAANAATAAGKVAAAKNSAKMAAVDKVVKLLTDLQAKVTKEGEDEALAYQKVCRMCETAKKEKTASIKKEGDEINRLNAAIVLLTTTKESMDNGIQSNVDGIKSDENKVVGLKALHAKDLAIYNANKADMMGAISSLADAIKLVKNGVSSASLLQVQSVGKSVNQVLLLADALGLVDVETQGVASLFQQDAQGKPAVEMEDYKTHSGGIIATLEKLQGDYRKMSAKTDADEVTRISNYNKRVQHFTDAIKAKTHEMEKIQQVARNEAAADIATNTQELNTNTAQKRDEQGFLDAMNSMCTNKETAHNQRTKTRSAELTALVKTAVIIKGTVAAKTSSATLRLSQTVTSLGLADAVASSDSAMEALEAEAESAEAPTGFLQKKAVNEHQPEARRLVLALFTARGEATQSEALTRLAGRIAADPFAKIQGLIQGMIEKKLDEAGQEANKKGKCDKDTSDAKQKLEYASDDMADLNARLASQSALSDQMAEDIAELTTSIAELNAMAQKTNTARAKESFQNKQTVRDAKEGKAAVEAAIKVLNDFYGTARNAANKIAAPKDVASFDATASEAKVAARMEAAGQDDDIDEAYAGSSAAAGGIIGMMEVVQSDFARTISQTDSAEAAAVDEHRAFLTASGSSLAEKGVAKNEKRKLKNEADTKVSADEGKLGTRSGVAVAAIGELKVLKKICQPKGQTYEERVAKREDEIASLNKGLCIMDAGEC